jgi:hypothetical protein
MEITNLLTVGYLQSIKVRSLMAADGQCIECSAPTAQRCQCGVAWYCSVACQTAGWPAHRALCPAFQLAALPGRGQGLLTTRAVARGETVLLERPLIVVDPAKTDYRPKESIREQVRGGSRLKPVDG